MFRVGLYWLVVNMAMYLWVLQISGRFLDEQDENSFSRDALLCVVIISIIIIIIISCVHRLFQTLVSYEHGACLTETDCNSLWMENQST
jgi:uncharacterized membrane protein YvlD (DUF360 family)